MLLSRKSDFLFFKVSNTNMPQFFFMNKTFLFVKLEFLLNWDFVNPHKISAHSDNKQKSFVPKKNMRHVTIRDFKK